MPGKYILHKCSDSGCQFIEKVCPRCNKTKFLINFRTHNTCTNGHLSYCKQCRYDATFQANRDATKRLYDKNFEINKNHNCETEGCTKKSKLCNYCRTPHTLNFFTIDKGCINVHKTTCRIGNYARCARRRELDWNLSNEYAMKIFDNRCIYCNVKNCYMGIDRINNSVGYIEGNVVPCCSTCNFMKGGKSYEEYIKFIIYLTTIPKAHIERLREAIA